MRSAVFWRSGSQIVAQVIAWASTLIVIRLLDPADYGLYAMAQAVFVFLSFLNGYGFASSLIQSEEVTPKALRQAFGILLLLNGSLAVVQYFGAPLLADYYGQPIVTDLLRTTALIYLATPFFVIPEVVMARALEFRKQALVNLIAAIAGAVTALTLALNGYGVWTLVYAPIVLFWTRAIGLTIAARLLVWPSFDLRGTGRMLGFGGAILVTQLLWLIQSQSDIFIAGRSFAPRELGLYAEALFLTQVLMSKFVPPLNEVAFPAYSRIQHDIAALRAGFLKAMRLVGLVTFPAYLGIVATAGPLIADVARPQMGRDDAAGANHRAVDAGDDAADSLLARDHRARPSANRDTDRGVRRGRLHPGLFGRRAIRRDRPVDRVAHRLARAARLHILSVAPADRLHDWRYLARGA